MISRIKQGIDLRHAHAFGALRDLFDPVSRADLAFLDDPEIKTRTPVRYHQRRHFRMIETQTEPVASDAWLADFEDRAADPVAVANKDLCVGQPIDREIFAEIAMNEVRPAKMIGPVTIGIELVDHEGALLAAVACQIGLSIAGQIEPSREDAPFDRLFPDRGADDFSPPRHVTRQPDIDRHDDIHLEPPPVPMRVLFNSTQSYWRDIVDARVPSHPILTGTRRVRLLVQPPR